MKCIALALLLATLAGPAAPAELVVRLRSEAGAAIADGVVFIPQRRGAEAAPAPARRATVLQRGRQFEPFVTVVQTGTAIDFPNEDPILHHVYSFSPAKRFEIKLYRGSPPAPIVFDSPGIVALGCNVHDWMIGYVVVLDTALAAKTDRDGVARIAGVPAGRHEVMGWAPGSRAPVRIAEVELGAADLRNVEAALAGPVRTRPKPPPQDPMRY